MLSLLATGYIKADHWIGEFVIKDENIIPDLTGDLRFDENVCDSANQTEDAFWQNNYVTTMRRFCCIKIKWRRTGG